MNNIYDLFFQHSQTLQGLMIDTVIFIGLIDVVSGLIKSIISFSKRRY